MAQILVKTPITSNGRDVVLNANGQIRYKETILEEAARVVIEKKNAKLPQALKKIILPYNPNSNKIEEVEEVKEKPVKKTKNDKSE